MDLRELAPHRILRRLHEQSLRRSIHKTTAFLKLAVDAEREIELTGGEQNPFRQEHFYYETARRLQEMQDELFSRHLPKEFERINELFGVVDERWNTTVDIARDVDALLRPTGLFPYAIDGRAKSNFSIWDKLERYPLDPNEIFDVIGMRISFLDKEHVDRAKDVLLGAFPLMEPHHFRHFGKIHAPIRDFLTQPKQGGYAALHMNMLHEGNIFETQLTTRDAFIGMHRSSPFPAGALIGYK